MTELNVPVDALHAECILARRAINFAYENAKARVACWVPRTDPRSNMRRVMSTPSVLELPRAT